MNKNNCLSTARNLFDTLCHYYGYDWDKVMQQESVKMEIGHYIMQKELFSMYKDLNEGNGFLAWTKGMNMLTDTIREWRFSVKTESTNLRTHAEFLLKAADFIDMNASIREADHHEWQQTLQSMLLLTDEEKALPDLTTKCPRTMVDEVKTMLSKRGLLNIYRYRGDKPLVMDNIRQTVVGENFIMSDDVSKLFNVRQCCADDELKIYVSLNIDKVLDFSYFLIAVNNGDSWWMVTDEPQFANPDAKQGISHRGGYRFRQDNFEYSVFPYCYLDKIEQWRRDNTQLAKEGEIHREFYSVTLKEWPVECRVFLNLLLEQVFQKLMADDDSFKRVKFGYEYSETLLLENKMIDQTVADELSQTFDYESENTNRRTAVNNLILKDADKTQHSLVKMDASIVADKLAIWSGNLMDADKFRQLEAWAVFDEETQRRKRLLHGAEANESTDTSKMHRMLQRNFRNRIETLFAARVMLVFIYDPDMVYDEEGRSIGFSHHQEVNLIPLHSNSRWYIHTIPALGSGLDEPCTYCGKHPIKKDHTSTLCIPHYSMLAWLAGVTREELPYYYCNYMGHWYYNYCGNHLLSNINPLYRLKDVLSQKRQNGFEIDIHLCKRCRTALAKRGMDKGVLVINAKTCQSEGVFSINDFKQFLLSKGIKDTSFQETVYL